MDISAVGTDQFVTRKFVRRVFRWEGNRLGVTDTVYPPFEPVAVAGREVRVVGRSYTMNDFGLPDRVRSQGHDLLAAPIRLRYQTTDGEGVWTGGSGKFARQDVQAAVFKGRAESPAVTVRTTSTGKSPEPV